MCLPLLTDAKHMSINKLHRTLTPEHPSCIQLINGLQLSTVAVAMLITVYCCCVVATGLYMITSDFQHFIYLPAFSQGSAPLYISSDSIEKADGYSFHGL